MENSQMCHEADGLFGTAAPQRASMPLPVPEDFVPLRLVLQPSGATVELTQTDVLLGRHSQADIRLALPEVSRRHCRFLFSQGQWQVIDLNSLNGVFVNGQQIRQTTVCSGDLLRVGGFTFLLDVSVSPTKAGESEAIEGVIQGAFLERANLAESPAQEGTPRRQAS